jgi:hypothetical protein
MDKTTAAWVRYLSDSGYVEIGDTGDSCAMCGRGTFREISINGKQYEMCHVCHISRDTIDRDTETEAANMAKFKALLAQNKG